MDRAVEQVGVVVQHSLAVEVVGKLVEELVPDEVLVLDELQDGLPVSKRVASVAVAADQDWVRLLLCLK
jgi:hypothetical protein